MDNNKKTIAGFLQQDLDVIIREAKEEALRNVKEKLTKSFEKSLCQRAIDQIKGLTLNSLPSVETSDLSSSLLEEGSAQERFSNDKKIYLFGITGVDAESFITQGNYEGMVQGWQVYTFSYKDLLPVICEVSQEEFNEVKFQELAGNRDWLEKKAECHQKVISAVMETYAIIPMRFSTLFPSEDQLRIFLEENYTTLEELLKYIQNKTEWGLKLYLNEELFKKFLQEKDESINNLMNEMSLNQTGKGYLPKKRLANRIEQKAFDLAEEVHRRLRRFSAGAVLNKLLPRELTHRKERMILNGAYLLEKNKEENFFETIKWLEETEGPRGFVFEISGPWPCYNFCQISLTST